MRKHKVEAVVTRCNAALSEAVGKQFLMDAEGSVNFIFVTQKMKVLY
jgi:hypothetical protein